MHIYTITEVTQMVIRLVNSGLNAEKAFQVASAAYGYEIDELINSYNKLQK